MRAGRAGAGPVAWVGVITRVEEAQRSGTIVWDLYVEHHYWFWNEDFGMQPERAILSARGEGGFRCRGVKSEGASTELTTDATPLRLIPEARQGDMAIAVGEPIRVADDGVVHLRCLVVEFRPRAYYSTDRWDYGRAFLKGDLNDIRVLRRP